MADPAFFDLSTWRRFLLSGADRRQFLQGLVTNDVASAAARQELPCCLLTPKGKLQAHFWYYDLGTESLLVCPARSAGNLKAAIEKVLPLSDSRLSDASDRWAQYWISGAEDSAKAGLTLPFSALGERGALALVDRAVAEEFERVWPGRRLSPEEFECLRIERGLPAYGVDMDEDTIPLEARLDRAISYTKGCYMGQETISRIHHMGHVNRLLVGLRFEGRPPAAPAPALFDGAEAGLMTSACAASSGGTLGLATVRAERAAAGTLLAVAGRAATVVDLWPANASGA